MRRVLLATALTLATTSLAMAEKAPPKGGLIEAPGHGIHGQPWAQPEALRPLSEVHGFAQIPAPVFTVQPQDNDFYLAEDEVVGNGSGPKPLRFAIPVPIALSMDDGEWINVEGGKVWRVVLASPNATTARLHLTGLNVPAGQEMRLSSPGWEETVIGPIEGAGEFGTGEAWSMSLPTNEILVEWFVPTGAA